MDSRGNTVRGFARSLAILAAALAASGPSAAAAAGWERPFPIVEGEPGRWSLRSPWLGVSFTDREVLLGTRGTGVIRWSLEGSLPAAIVGEQGAEADLFTVDGKGGFTAVRYRGVFPGVDAVWSSKVGGVEYALHARPGAMPRRVVVRLDGVDRVALAGPKALDLVAGGARLREEGLTCFQPTAGGRRPLECRYRILGSAGERAWRVAIEVERGDPALGVVVKSEAEWDAMPAGYYVSFGSSNADTAVPLAISSDGTIYVGGSSYSVGFTVASAKEYGWVGRFTATESKVTSIGPGETTVTGQEARVRGLALSNDGSKVYVVGEMQPASSTQKGTVRDAFIAVLDATNLLMTKISYLGDGAQGVAYAVAASDNDVFVAYTTSSAITSNDLHLCKLNATGVASDEWACTREVILRGNGQDIPVALALSQNNVVVIGTSNSTDFYSTGDAHHGDEDIIVGVYTRASLAQMSLQYLGGEATDRAGGVVIVGDEITVVGTTNSEDIALTDNARDAEPSGDSEGLIARLALNGGDILYMSLFGAHGADALTGVAYDPDSGEYCIGGSVASGGTSSGLPGLFRDELLGPSDAFVSRLRLDSELAFEVVWTALVGGSGQETPGAVACAGGQTTIVGQTTSPDFPEKELANTADQFPGDVNGDRPGDAFFATVLSEKENPQPGEVRASLNTSSSEWTLDVSWDPFVDASSVKYSVGVGTADSDEPELLEYFDRHQETSHTFENFRAGIGTTIRAFVRATDFFGNSTVARSDPIIVPSDSDGGIPDSGGQDAGHDAGDEPSQTDAGADAGHDAGIADAGFDAGFDAGIDARPDAGGADAAPISARQAVLGWGCSSAGGTAFIGLGTLALALLLGPRRRS